MAVRSMISLYEFRDELNKISPTFCVAKWKQVTVHLESGLTHSCHHPKAHIISLEDLKNNITGLHNTPYKKAMRKLMLDGKIVPECEYCNRVDRQNSDNLSDRVLKSSESSWAKKYIPEILSKPFDDDVFPSYFEVSFSSVCNGTCIYCSPTFSSKWAEEIEKFGPYDVSSVTRGPESNPVPKYANKTINPYIDAFWKWWPELHQKLDEFRITGGEPLLSKNTYKILDYMIKHPKSDLKISLNSNFCINDKIFNKFIEKYKRVAQKQKVTVFTSGEAYGEKAEYIRPGMNYNHWIDNCRTYLSKVPNSKLAFMCTYNILSITSFIDFLRDVKKLKKEYPKRVSVDIPFLMNPPYLQANIVTSDFLKYIEESINYMYEHIKRWSPLAGTQSDYSFYEYEVSKLIRIFRLVEAQKEDRLLTYARVDFSKFIDQHDERYNTKFLDIFPEYEDFYSLCKKTKL